VTVSIPLPKTEFWVHCADCKHSWVAFYTPIRLDLIPRFGNIACPKCAGTSVYCGASEERPT
jgi:hypothetical protein